MIVKARWRQLQRQRGLVQAANGTVASVLESTIQHNSSPEWMFYANLSNRPDLLTRPLSSLNTVRQNAHRMSVLCVGARTEAELLSVAACGFPLSNIFAVDLFSYSPSITVADATALPFQDKRFDVVLLGWVLEFVPDYGRALCESWRILRDGGLLALGAMYHPVTTDIDQYQRVRHVVGRTWRPQSAEDIVEAIEFATGDRVRQVFVSDIDPLDRDKRGDLLVIVGKGPKHEG